MKHVFPIRVYYQDTDAGGIVYHSKYLDFAERARSELLVDMGFSNKILIEKGVAFVLRNASISYNAPARLDDVIHVETRVKEIKNASLIMNHSFMVDGKEMVSIELQLAVINPLNLRPIRLSPELKELFLRYSQES